MKVNIMPSDVLLDERDAYFNADTLISGQAELNKLNAMQEKYSAWKNTILREGLRQSVADFIEFGIKRIAHRETRYAFIDYLTKLNAEKITKLLNMLLGIDLATLSDSQAKEIFLVPRRASTTLENLAPTAAPGYGASLEAVFVMPEIFRPLSENLEKKNPGSNTAPLSPAMELFTSYQEWAMNNDNKKAVEELDKKLEPGVVFDSDLRRSAPIQQLVPAHNSSFPRTPSSSASVANPLSSLVGDNLEEGSSVPYARMSGDSNTFRRSSTNAHHHMADLNLNTIRDFYTYEKVQNMPLSKAKQAEFLLWCDERMQRIFDYYESILSTEEDAKNDKQSSDQLIFQNWRFYEYAKAFETAKANLTDSTTREFLISLNSYITIVNAQLPAAYERLSDRTEQGHYFYKNFRDTAQDLYTQYLKLEHWKLQQAMLASPDNQYLDVMFSILSSPKDEVTQRSWFQFAWDMTQIPTMMGAVRVLAEFVVGKPDAEAREVPHPQTPDELLNKKTLVRYDFYQPGSYSLSPIKTVFLNCTPTEDTFENLKQKLDGTIILEGDSLDEMSATLKGKPLTVKKTTDVPRRAALSEAEQELFNICLTRNDNALNNFIQKHGALTTLSYFLTSFAYFGEVAYIATDYLLRAKALKPLLTAFGINNILDISGVEALYNSISTIAVTIANITFDPKSTAEGLLKEFFLNPENSLKTVGNSELRNNLSTLLGYWNVLVGKKIWEKPLLSLAFAGMAIGGASAETLALQALKELLGMSDAQFDAFFPPGASALIFSGLAYYFFFNYKGIFNNTGKGIEKMKEILFKAFNEDSPRDRWAAGTVSTLLLLAIGERCFRMAYGPYITSMALGSSQTEAMMWATIVGASTLVTTPVTRVLNAASLVYADLSPEQWNLGLKSYMSLSAWQKWSPGLSDASMVLVGTCAYSLAKLVSLSFSGENLAANLLSTTVGLFTAYKFLQIFQASVRQKTITGLAQGSTFSFGQTAAWIAGIAVALDQLSRAVGGVTSLSTLLSFLNNDTPGNSLLLIVAFGAMAYIQKTVFDLQFPDVGATMQGYLNAVSETSVGRGFNEAVRNTTQLGTTLTGYSTYTVFGSTAKARPDRSTADYSAVRAVQQERNHERGVELTASAPALGFSSSV